MALMDFIRKELIEIIEWTDDSRDTLAYRWPDQDKQIKNGAQLIVRESQVAQFVYLGQYADTLGPGKHTLKTDNIPVLSTLLGWKYGFETPFKADVYYVVTRVFPGNKWGTANPIMLRDPDFGVVRVRAYGQYDFKIVNPPLFLKEVAGTDHHFRLDEFIDVMRSKIVTVFTEAIANAKVPVLDVAGRYSEIGNALLPGINPVTTAKYGIEITSFNIENVSLPPEVEQALDRRTSMGIVGDLSRYTQFQAAEAMRAAAQNPGAAGAGIGVIVGQVLGAQAAGPWGTRAPEAAAAPPPPPPPPPARLWHVAEAGKASGPFPIEELARRAAAGTLGRDTLVWSPGMAGWTAAGQVEEVARLLAMAPPPLPGSS